jgi:hypothetical protein
MDPEPDCFSRVSLIYERGSKRKNYKGNKRRIIIAKWLGSSDMLGNGRLGSKVRSGQVGFGQVRLVF